MTANIHKYDIVEEKISCTNDLFETLVVRESELSPNKLYFRDDLRKIWLYQANCIVQQLDMKILNDITREKPNPPPNLSCRYFTH